MGFLGRLFTGKPAFEAPHDDSGGQSATVQPEQSASTPTVKSGSKYIPEVEVEETECDVKDSHMRVECHIKNKSSVEIKIEGVRLLGSERQLSQYLKPGEKRKMIVYEGPLVSTRDPHAYLNYQGMDSDDFQTYHTVEFKDEPGKMYSVRRIRRANPVKDT